MHHPSRDDVMIDRYSLKVGASCLKACSTISKNIDRGGVPIDPEFW